MSMEDPLGPGWEALAVLVEWDLHSVLGGSHKGFEAGGLACRSHLEAQDTAS